MNIFSQGRIAEFRDIVLPIGGLLFLVVLFSLLEPNFFQVGTFFSVLRESSVLLVVAIGVSFLVVMGSIDLSTGALVTLVGLVSATLAKEGFTVLAIVAGLGVGLVAGAINGVLFAYARVPSFLATLGSGLVMSGVGLWFVGGRPVQIFNDNYLAISQTRIFSVLPSLALLAIGSWLLFAFVQTKTRFGRYTFAVGGAEQVSRLAGISVDQVKFWAMVIAGLTSAIGGILLSARVGAATPDMGARLTLDVIAAVVIGGTALSGGVGGVHRTILGVMVITVLGVGLNTVGAPPFLQDVIQGSVVVLAVALTFDRKKLTVLK